MLQGLKPKSQGRGERHSAAWGKRLGAVLLLLAAQTTFAQSGKFAPDLAPSVTRAKQGLAGKETVQVIVQYKQTPQSEQEGRVQRLGANLNRRLGVVKGIALTIPVSALPALEADPEIASVSIDHPLKGMDDYTNAAMNVSAAWNAGYNGAGIGVAVIDSGINDTHPDLWDSNERYSRVVYHQDFTGTGTRNFAGRVVYDLYGHGTHVAGIIGGNGYLSNGNYAGVAPAVTLIDLKVLNAQGAGTDSMVIAAIDRRSTFRTSTTFKSLTCHWEGQSPCLTRRILCARQRKRPGRAESLWSRQRATTVGSAYSAATDMEPSWPRATIRWCSQWAR